MRQAAELLTTYAAYHRDRRNIATHFVGVPLIMFAVVLLLSRPALAVDVLPALTELPAWGGLPLSPAVVVFALAAAWYLTRGEFLLGLVTSAVIGAMVLAAAPLAAGSTAAWLGWGLGLFLIGWVIQFVGHWYEGRKPAFVDDIAGLMVGPMFVVAEAMFAAGWNRPLLARIEREVGPTRERKLSVIRP